jgi:hypothetical protein
MNRYYNKNTATKQLILVLANSDWRFPSPLFTAAGDEQSVSLTLKDGAPRCRSWQHWSIYAIDVTFLGLNLFNENLPLLNLLSLHK